MISTSIHGIKSIRQSRITIKDKNEETIEIDLYSTDVLDISQLELIVGKEEELTQQQLDVTELRRLYEEFITMRGQIQQQGVDIKEMMDRLE